MTKEKNEKKNERKLSGKKKIALIIAAVVIIVVLALVLPKVFSNRKNLPEYNGSELFEVSDDEALAFHTDGNVKSIAGGIVTTDSTVYFMKKDGVVYDDIKHGYSSPVTKSCGDYAIIFERSTGRYTFSHKARTLKNTTPGNEILCADVSKNGNYLIIDRESATELTATLRSKKDKILFQWRCAESYITNCALSPDGQCFAVASYRVVNGEQKTEIYIFNIKSTDIEKVVETNNNFIYAMRFINKNTLSIVTDSEYIVSDIRNDDVKRADCSFDEITGSYFFDTSVALLKSDFGSIDSSTITVYNRNAEEVVSCESEGKVMDFCFDRSFVYIMTPGKIVVWSIASGEKFNEIEIAGGINSFCVMSGTACCVSDSGVFRYKVK